MPILALGISYRRAPVDLLERLAFGKDDLPKAYHHLTRTESVQGAVLVSTCNRVEVFGEVDAYHTGFQALRGFLAESRGVEADDFAEPLYSHYEEQAVEHLLWVAAGLDSMVLGEPQILSQVRQAYLAAEAEGAAGPILTQLFRRAIRTGRRARSETAIGASPAAFVEAAGELAGREVGGLAGRRVLVVGAGKMSELAARHLAGMGAGAVTVLSRSEEKAQRLARVVGGTGGALSELPSALRDADVVVSATGAAGTVIEADAIREAFGDREERPLFLLDLAVPRDVEPEVGDFPGVHLVNIDDLRDVVARTDESEVRRVREIVGEEVARFTAWRRAARLAPVIEGLYAKGEQIRRAELDRIRSRLVGLDQEELAAVEAATRAIVAKLLHHPVVKAKELPDAADQRTLIAELFGLELPKE